MRFSLMISAAVATRCFESDFEASKLQVCEGKISQDIHRNGEACKLELLGNVPPVSTRYVVSSTHPYFSHCIRLGSDTDTVKGDVSVRPSGMKSSVSADGTTWVTVNCDFRPRTQSLMTESVRNALPNFMRVALNVDDDIPTRFFGSYSMPAASAAATPGIDDPIFQKHICARLMLRRQLIIEKLGSTNHFVQTYKDRTGQELEDQNPVEGPERPTAGPLSDKGPGFHYFV